MTEFFLGYAIATNTEHSADISCFCTSSCLILSHAGYMEMPAALACKVNFISCRATPPCTDLLLGIYLNFVTGKPFSFAINKLNVTCKGVNNNVCIECYVFLPTLIGVVHFVTVKVIIATCGR